MSKKIKVILFTALTAMIVVCAVVFLYLTYGNLSKDNATQEDQLESEANVYEPEEAIAMRIVEEEYTMEGYISDDTVAIKSEPSEDSASIAILPLNYHVNYSIYNSLWAKMSYAGQDGYVLRDNIVDKKIDSTLYMVDAPSYFKSYMDYRTITNQDSDQYKLQSLYAETGSYGIRMVGNRYCVAMGSYFTADIGQYLDIVLENGTIIQCILGDQKDNSHTDINNIYTVHSLCTSEFIIDENHISEEVLRYGDISYCSEFWDSRVKDVIVYDKNIFEEE